MKEAIVIGAGIAGLAAAKVLSEKFENVMVYEGALAPQTHHLHVLLKSGQVALEKIFPGIRCRLVENGCPDLDWALDTVWESKAGIFPRYESSVKALSMSRSFLVNTMRQMINQSRVTFIQENVTDLSNFKGCLVVIAGGQNFPLTRLLGTEMVKEEKHEINLTYRSIIFSSDEIDMKDFKQYYYQLDPSMARMGGVISPIDGNRVIATLIEREEHVSECRGLEGFLDKAQEIPSEMFLNILKNARPLSELRTCRKKLIHRRTINLEKLPSNVIVMGDALLSLNPIFGQGMTVAFKEALVLKEMLQFQNFSSMEFQKKCSKENLLPYRLSLLGSRESGLGKNLLQGYLKVCRHSKMFHHFFLRQLHSLSLFPVKSI